MSTRELRIRPEDTTVLVVDDQALIRVTLRAILTKEGYRVLESDSIHKALALVDQETIHLVLCDIHLPGESGMDFVRAIQPRLPGIAVVMVSAADDTSTAIDCLQLGAFGYVLKPFQPREIIVQVSGALRRRVLEVEFKDREALLSKKVREQTEEIRDSREEIAFRLISASEHRDQETGQHVRRIGLFAAELARLLGWDEERVEWIRAAAPMHDIGKVGVPDAILQKPGALTDAEWVLMREHTSMGAQILKGSKVPFIQMGARIAVGHHEKWDGTGYPRGLKGEVIPLEARITALVDVYDALSNKRHYKDAWPEAQVITFMEERSGTHFDPEIFRVFMDHLPAFREILKANPDAVEREDANPLR